MRSADLSGAVSGDRGRERVARSGIEDRSKTFIEMQELETGAWLGVIEDSELVEDHPEGYDEQRLGGGKLDARKRTTQWLGGWLTVSPRQAG